MACPNFKKGLKMVSGPLGVKPMDLRQSCLASPSLPRGKNS
jgi:hypothetical protein